MICAACYTVIEKEVQESAKKSYPALVKKFNEKFGKPYTTSFEEFCSDWIGHTIYDRYYRKVMKESYVKKRNEVLKKLPNELTKNELKQLRRSAVCDLTGRNDDVTIDHFIPVEWGHGGVYIGNIYFISRKLNSSKSSINPFERIKKPEVLNVVDFSKWNKLISRLAEDNGLTINEFEEYVNWCEKNKRT